jgi:hypothetical protein
MLQPQKHAVARRAGHVADRLFLGACIAAYLMLIGSVFTALRIYVG